MLQTQALNSQVEVRLPNLCWNLRDRMDKSALRSENEDPKFHSTAPLLRWEPPPAEETQKEVRNSSAWKWGLLKHRPTGGLSIAQE